MSPAVTRHHHGRQRRAFRVGLVLIATAMSVPAAAAVAAAQPIAPTFEVLVATTPCTASARACVDLEDHQAWLVENGQVVRGPVPIMDGLEDDTPVGTFAVEWKAERWTSRELGTSMPYSVFFAPGGIAFHEGRQDTPSAGCVKLGAVDASAFFAFLNVGDEVQVR